MYSGVSKTLFCTIPLSLSLSLTSALASASASPQPSITCSYPQFTNHGFFSYNSGMKLHPKIAVYEKDIFPPHCAMRMVHCLHASWNRDKFSQHERYTRSKKQHQRLNVSKDINNHEVGNDGRQRIGDI